jgi:transposase-like protein
MQHQSTSSALESTVSWETLEEWTRVRIQAFIQALIEEEMTAFLGRRKSEGRQALDARPGYHIGYGKPRRRRRDLGRAFLRHAGLFEDQDSCYCMKRDSIMLPLSSVVGAEP